MRKIEMPKTWRHTREFARVPARMTARIKTPARDVPQCPVIDVGFGGLYVDHCLDEDEECNIVISFADFPEVTPVEALGRVVRVDPERGTAIMFTEMPLELFDRLDQLMLLKGAEPDPD